MVILAGWMVQVNPLALCLTGMVMTVYPSSSHPAERFPSRLAKDGLATALQLLQVAM